MSPIAALAVAYAQERLHQAMAFERFAPDKAPVSIQQLNYLMEEYQHAMDYYSAFNFDDED